MIGTRCRVTYLDSGNVEHVVEVTADSLFEAAAAAVKAFREGALLDELPVPGRSYASLYFRSQSSTESVYSEWNSGLKPAW